MALTPGVRLGPYEIVALLGAGGMGEVYRARDPRLGREVAIKVLPESMAADPSRLPRFQHEARAVAALSLPNVVAVFDVGVDPVPFLVSELLEGETLRMRLGRGPLPVKASLDLAMQLVAGLAAAHARHIVHRDLKPENIFVTRDGALKILDFGLAKASTASAGGSGGVDATMSVTMPGVVLGTAGYMAPEQVRGEVADPRSDVFAVGAILFEMVTGDRAFHRNSPADTMSAILREHPRDITTHGAPPAVARIVRRCLDKEPDERFQSARDLKFALESISDGQPAAHAKKGDDKSIAVLPFADLSPDRSQQAFCEGIAADIINALGSVPGLRVTSRTSAVRCREKGLDIAEIGAHLNVQSILEGTVRKAGDRLRLTAQLVDARDGTQLWTSRYDRGEGDIFDLQDEMTAAIVENLRVQLGTSGAAPNVKRFTDNFDAYRLYLKGRYYWERRNQQFLRIALDYFERAIAADPDYALAHAGVADCYTVSAIFGFMPGVEARPLAAAAAERAVQLDPQLAEAHHARGAAYQWLDWELPSAERSLLRAIELNPQMAIARAYLGVLRVWTGRPAEGISEARRAIELEPESALLAYICSNALYWSRRFPESREQANRALTLDPAALFNHWWRPSLLVAMGAIDEAIKPTEDALRLSTRPAFLVSSLARGYAESGLRDDAMALVDELLRRSKSEYIAPLHLADAFAALDDRTRAFDFFEQALRDRNASMILMSSTPFYDRIRDDPRFAAVLAQIRA
jgi:serine/threonine protein kinase/Tfp pilus assembly protein PilF